MRKGLFKQKKGMSIFFPGMVLIVFVTIISLTIILNHKMDSMTYTLGKVQSSILNLYDSAGDEQYYIDIGAMQAQRDTFYDMVKYGGGLNYKCGEYMGYKLWVNQKGRCYSTDSNAQVSTLIERNLNPVIKLRRDLPLNFNIDIQNNVIVGTNVNTIQQDVLIDQKTEESLPEQAVKKAIEDSQEYNKPPEETEPPASEDETPPSQEETEPPASEDETPPQSNYNGKIFPYRKIQMSVLSGAMKTTAERLNDIKIDTGQTARQYLEEKSREKDIDPYFVLALITRESGGNSLALSYSGAAGLFQFVPVTARGFNLNVPKYEKEEMKCYSKSKGTVIYSGTLSKCNTCLFSDLKSEPYNKCVFKGVEQRGPNTDDERFDSKKSIDAGLEFISELTRKNDRDVLKVLFAYNRGESMLRKCMDEPKLYDCKYLDNNGKIEVNGYYTYIEPKYESTFNVGNIG